MGRPSSYTTEIADRICERISEGEPLRVICREDGMPAWQTVYDWKVQHEDFSKRFAEARARGADAIAEQALSIQDEKPEYHDTEFGPRVDTGFVAWQKNRFEGRLKLLAKWFPQQYGDKVNVEHSGKVELADALQAARDRLKGRGDGD